MPNKKNEPYGTCQLMPTYDFELTDILPIIPIIISIGAFIISFYSYQQTRKIEEKKSKWEQIRMAREIFVTVLNLENKLLDLGAENQTSSYQTEKDRILSRADATRVTMAQHLDFFADLVISGRMGWDVVFLYTTHLLRCGGEINKTINLQTFGPNLIKLLRSLLAVTGRTYEEFYDI